MKKTVFDDLGSIFDELKLKNVFDDVELPTEDKVIFSPEMSKLIKEEIYKEIVNIPVGKIVSRIMEKEIERKAKENDGIKSEVSEQVVEIKNESSEKINSLRNEYEKFTETIRKKYDDLKSGILSIQKEPRYQFGGFAPPNPLNHINQSLVSTDGTWSGISWETVSTDITGSTLTTLTGFLRGNGTDVDAVNTVSTTEFGYLAGVTSAIQGQINALPSSVSNSDGTLTISPTTGAVVASLALAHANVWTGCYRNEDMDSQGTRLRTADC